MKRTDIVLRGAAVTTLRSLMDHFERARGTKPSKNAVAAEALTWLWREVNRGHVTQHDLSAAGPAAGGEGTAEGGEA